MKHNLKNPKVIELWGSYVASEKLSDGAYIKVGEYVSKEVADELADSLRELLHLHSCEQEGIESGMQSAKDWSEVVEKAQEAIKNATE